MSNNVIDLRAATRQEAQTQVPAPGAIEPIYDKSLASVAALVYEANADNNALAAKVHAANHGLAERVNVIDGRMTWLAEECRRRYAEWQSHEQQASHVSFIGPLGLYVVMLFTILGEWKLAATALAGLQFEDWETYLAAGGLVGVALLLTKGVAFGLRWLACQRLQQRPLNVFEVIMVLATFATLVAMLMGMNEARVGYSQADKDSGGAGVSDVTTSGLALLQGALYTAQITIFWFLTGPNMLADRARLNFEAAKKRLVALHSSRSRLAAQLNRNVNVLHEQWARNINTTSQFLAHYLRELHVHGKVLPEGVRAEIRADWFDPVPARVWAVVDPVPALIQDLVAGVPPVPHAATPTSAPESAVAVAPKVAAEPPKGQALPLARP